VDEAIRLAKTLVQNGALILITGSLFVCDEARGLLKKAETYAAVE
jgi:folylpolyglutamate synthase/dihydropteroate synthase